MNIKANVTSGLGTVVVERSRRAISTKSNGQRFFIEIKTQRSPFHEIERAVFIDAKDLNGVQF